MCVCCRSLSTLCCRKNTQSGVGSCRNKDCTLCGWRGTRPSPTSASVLKTQRTSFCTTRSCSASSTRVWYVSTVRHVDTVMSFSLLALGKERGAMFLCLCFHMQPLPEAKAMLYNQMTLRSLPEPERIRHSHAFKICKNFQVPSSCHVLLLLLHCLWVRIQTGKSCARSYHGRNYFSHQNVGEVNSRYVCWLQ